MIKTNLHTHTTFCDGNNTPEEMVLAAMERNFESIGFSGHSYTPFDTSYCMTDTLGYAREITRLKKKYAGAIDIFCGIELDAFGEAGFSPDFTIGSVHYVEKEGSYFSVDDDEESLCRFVAAYDSPEAAVTAYYETVCLMAEKRRPDVIGHLDLVTKYNMGERYFDEGASWYKAAVINAIEESKPFCPIFEINTSAMAGGRKKGPYPAEWIISELYQHGCQVILSSDAHRCDKLDFGFEEAEELARNAGYEKFVRLTKQGWDKD